jgi:hypothetical protein
MQARTLTPVAIFGYHVRYVVPLFQRPYVWTREDQWLPLWEDVQAVAERLLSSSSNSVPPHFLGAIVLDHSPNPTGFIAAKSVIDGQQRLTTLQLLLDAAQFVAGKFGRDIDAKALRVLVLNDAEIAQDPSEELKVWPTNRDRRAFTAAMKDDAAVAGPLAFTQIAKAHAFFTDTITRWALDGATPDLTKNRITALTHTLREHLKLVVIDLDEGDNSQVIFETLNHRGARLLAADLIKNLVFQVAEAQGLDVEGLYENHWSHLDTDYWRQRVARGRQFIPRIDIFVNYWLIMRLVREVPSDRIFVEFREHVMDARPSVEQLLAELARDARAFRALESRRRTTAIGRFRYRVLEAMDSAAVTPLLLWLVQWPEERLARKQRDAALAAIESWLVRRALCRLTNKEVPRLVVDLLRVLHSSGPEKAGDLTEAFLAEQSLDTRFWPTDDMVIDSLRDAPVYRMLLRSRLRMLLEAIEDRMRTAKAEDQACPLNLTVEHVMPQAWRQHWPLDPPDEIAALKRDRRIQTLGNLTLVSAKLNPELSNLPWVKAGAKGKRAVLLEHSLLKLNADLVAQHESQWTDDAIVARTDVMSRAAVKIWRRPRTPAKAPIDLDRAEKDVEPVGDPPDDADRADVPILQYQPLTDWLQGQTAESVPATFAEIEEALGLELPGKARIDATYWRRGSALARAINGGGYAATGIQLSEEQLTLVRLTDGKAP